MNLSVIICTHNPRPDYLRRVLDALKMQTLPKEQWELLVIDNASKEPLASCWDLSWHPLARHVCENELGLLPTRVRGIKESQAELLVFVDDDNVLNPDYLEQALAIFQSHPFLGALGGSIKPEFETAPPHWFDEYLHLLACAEVQEDRWSNLKSIYATIPPGAGICLRRAVADAFVHVINEDPRRQYLGRRGKTDLSSGEDNDLALTACDIGLGTGQFSRLRMTHLISAARLEENYLYRLIESICFTGLILEALRGRPPVPYPSSPLRAWLGRQRRRLFWSHHRYALFEAKLRGRLRACKVVSDWR